MIAVDTHRAEDLANEVAHVMLEARALILGGIATREQCTQLVIDMLGCEQVEELRVYVRDQIDCLVAN